MPEPFVKLNMWMASELGLSGNELIVFAVIHGYTAFCGGYQGGMDMLGKWCGLSRRNAYRVISPLIEKGLVKQTVSSKGRNASVYVSLVNRVNMTQLDAQLTVSNRDGKPCQNDTHIDNNRYIDKPPVSPLKGGGTAKPQRPRRKTRSQERATNILTDPRLAEDVERIVKESSEEFYQDSLDELRMN